MANHDPPSIPIRNAKDGNSVCPPWPSLLGVVMMTEDEAKQKWCPHARVTYLNNADDMAYAGNCTTDGMRTTGSHCIGSACMAWRWRNKKIWHDLNHHIENNGDEKSWERYCEENPLKGYCGLAGEPK